MEDVKPLPVPQPVPAEPITPAADISGQRFAALSRKEKEILKHQQAVKAERAEVEKQRAELAQWNKEKADFEALKKAGGLKAMKSLGYTYEGLTQEQMNDEEPTAEAKISGVKEEVETLKKQLEDKEKKALEAQKTELEANNQRVKQNWQSEIKSFIDDKTQDEVCELIRTNDAQGLFEQTIEQFYIASTEPDEEGNPTKPGKILSNSEAAEKVETFILNQLEANLKTKKGRALAERVLGIGQPSQIKADVEQALKLKQKTLDNSLTPSTPIVQKKVLRTEKERMEAAMKKLNDWEQGRGKQA